MDKNSNIPEIRWMAPATIATPAAAKGDESERTNSCALKFRPHPGPLPREEGECGSIVRPFESPRCNSRFAGITSIAQIRRAIFTWRWEQLLPLLGERAGVRASVISRNQLLLFVFWLCFGLFSAAAAEVFKNSDCLDCHLDPATTRKVDGKTVSLI